MLSGRTPRPLPNPQMLIKGVRSLSPDNTTVIEFYKPLTLIVGANGAGKTVSAKGGRREGMMARGGGARSLARRVQRP